jgi:cytochrome P450 PksS
VWLFLRYIRKLIQAQRAQPRDDLVSALVQAEEAGQQLSEDELVAMTVLMLIAGHETTVNRIGNGTLALLEHPAQLAKLRNDPALIRTAVEELLRFASPVETATERYAREEARIAGVTIPRGELGFAVIASANRDERQFTDPDKLEITREPNKHLAFGLGRTTASARRWRGWRASSPSVRCCGVRRGCGWRSRRRRCAGGPGWCCAD